MENTMVYWFTAKVKEKIEMNKEWAEHQEQQERFRREMWEEWDLFLNELQYPTPWYTRLLRSPRLKAVLIGIIQLITGILIGWAAVYFYLN